MWFELGSWQVSLSFLFDLYTAHMLLTVTGVSLAVHFYSVWYMRGDAHLGLFLSYLGWFTFFMQVLVMSDNLVSMLIGWEGIGVCSYLLIGYWSHRISASKSAAKAILVNRVSDGLLMWGVVWIWHHMGSLQYDLVAWHGLKSSWMGVAVLLGTMGKSAQMLFQVWLADAMEGPTPVSGLIHAATLVTAGVFVAIRVGPWGVGAAGTICAITALAAAVYAACMTDLKRTIAFSTCSQLGFMMAAAANGATEASLSHLMTHASFKAALFLAAGLAMHGAGSSQHVHRYGAARRSHAAMTTLLLASLALVGAPETSGFYSKEAILNYSYLHNGAHAIHLTLLLATGLTGCYASTLLVQCVCLDMSGSSRTPARQAGWVGLIALAGLLLDGVVKVWSQTHVGSALLTYAPVSAKTLPLAQVIAGALTALAGVSTVPFALINFCSTTWGFDPLYARGIVQAVLNCSISTFSAGDQGMLRI
jgi:NADH:ubiquinone oxidoreductase subunit 5 (subunit L)/multisubunit Na+/H+ antiporter MnhA subunit